MPLFPFCPSVVEKAPICFLGSSYKLLALYTLHSLGKGLNAVPSLLCSSCKLPNVRASQMHDPSPETRSPLSTLTSPKRMVATVPLLSWGLIPICWLLLLPGADSRSGEGGTLSRDSTLDSFFCTWQGLVCPQDAACAPLTAALCRRKGLHAVLRC